MTTTEITIQLTIMVSGNPVPYQPATGGENGEPAEGGEVEDVGIKLLEKFFRQLGPVLPEFNREQVKRTIETFLDVHSDWREKAEEELLAVAEDSDLRAADDRMELDAERKRGT